MQLSYTSAKCGHMFQMCSGVVRLTEHWLILWEYSETEKVMLWFSICQENNLTIIDCFGEQCADHSKSGMNSETDRCSVSYWQKQYSRVYLLSFWLTVFWVIKNVTEINKVAPIYVLKAQIVKRSFWMCVTLRKCSSQLYSRFFWIACVWERRLSGPQCVMWPVILTVSTVSDPSPELFLYGGISWTHKHGLIWLWVRQEASVVQNITLFLKWHMSMCSYCQTTYCAQITPVSYM